MQNNDFGAGFNSMASQDILECLSVIPMFEDLTHEQMLAVSKQTLLLTVEAGETVFREGDKGDFVCFVAEGLLAVVKSLEGGKFAELTSLPQGSSIGEMAVIDDFPRSATVIARKPSQLITMTRSQFHRVVTENPEIGIKLLKGIARVLSMNLRKTSANLVQHMLPLL
ncbi:Cyclic nucleotide-binding domain-containing protein [Desulfatibacillum alkenivorans DSM 16219]|uniref:Cyclic nucleotide-binding domain-containing protein n=1 Tax=Desulfatibacillum alkenivorans DSM 16219 TaxID=1121393 RepID=A0A1M6T182_9BACT|nr:cyclic nucleotide-binding domain-containing protein [Desulfatibacillum alkenivorans]SHK50687.1 Cyclic nucleotide-binding domain-containing protein [Desulfatibacillum alkenivorans DSM 16219]